MYSDDAPSDETMNLDEHDEEDTFASRRRKRRADASDTVPFGKNAGEISRARPTWEDMIIAYSTIPGYASIRDRDKGKRTHCSHEKVAALKHV